MPFPEAPERVHHLEEAVADDPGAVDGRAPVSRESDLRTPPSMERTAYPRPGSRSRGSSSEAETRDGPRGWPLGSVDGWNTSFEDNFESNLPTYLETLERAGPPARPDQLVLVGFQGDWLGDELVLPHRLAVRPSPAARPRALADGRRGWGHRARPGRRPTRSHALVEAAARW